MNIYIYWQIENFDNFLPLANFTKIKNTLCTDERSHSIPCSPNSTCLCEPKLGYCSATYYSTKIRPVPEACPKCGNPNNQKCLKKWSNCVRKKDKAAYGDVSYVVKFIIILFCV